MFADAHKDPRGKQVRETEIMNNTFKQNDKGTYWRFVWRCLIEWFGEDMCSSSYGMCMLCLTWIGFELTLVLLLNRVMDCFDFVVLAGLVFTDHNFYRQICS